MLADLPEEIKQQVYHYLAEHDFVTAKEIHDLWLAGKLSVTPTAVPLA